MSQAYFKFDISFDFAENGKFRDYVKFITKVWRYFIV